MSNPNKPKLIGGDPITIDTAVVSNNHCYHIIIRSEKKRKKKIVFDFSE